MNTLHKNADKFRVVLVEDHPMFREQLAHLIAKESDMAVCGEVDNARDALHLLETMAADVVIVDLTLKGPSGLELLKDLKARGIRVPVLVLSMHDELLYAERVLRAGARGYITKHETAKEVMAAIRKVLAGEIYLGTRMARVATSPCTTNCSTPNASCGRARVATSPSMKPRRKSWPRLAKSWPERSISGRAWPRGCSTAFPLIRRMTTADRK